MAKRRGQLRPGDRIRAEDVQAGINAGFKVGSIDGGDGIRVFHTPWSMTISLSKGNKHRILSAVITQAPPPGVPILPSQCKYWAQALDHRFVIVDEYPAYGRLVENDESAIYPAKVNDFCLIIRYVKPGTTEWAAGLMVLRENVARGPCPAP